MDIKKILLIVLAILVIIAVWATVFNGNDSPASQMADKENVSIAVTGDVMFARNMPNVLSMDSSQNLKDNDITPMGAGENEDEAHQAVVKEVNGRKITILNYMDSNNFAEYSYDSMPYANGSNPGYSAYDSEDAKNQIGENNDSDLIIAYMHFGNEYSNSPNEDQVKIAHELIDYGADIVIGSHPHVTQGIEMYNGKPIFYSLGNFIFDQSNTATHSAYFVQLDLTGNTGECTVYPIYISNYLPQFMSPEDGSALLSGLSPQCSQLQVTDEGTGKLTFNLTDG